jgi:DNA-binding response OmpR family regulator
VAGQDSRALVRTPSAPSPAVCSQYAGEVSMIDLEYQHALKHSQVVPPTSQDFAPLATLVRHAAHFVWHRTLVIEALGDANCDEQDYLNLYSACLREKLEDDRKRPPYILARRGAGCVFNLPRVRRQREPKQQMLSAYPLRCV